MRLSGPRFVVVVTALWLMFVAAVYLPDVGRGLIKDDFTWIAASRGGLSHPGALFSPPPGFFRPLVGLTFAIDYRLHELEPRGYGLTNLLLFAGCVGSLVLLCRALELSRETAVVAALVWSANPHGINMALLWISGRTALCLTILAVLAAVAWIRRRRVAAAILIFAAMLSKEEAVALPAILVAWRWTLQPESRGDSRVWVADLAAAAAPLAAYLLLRTRTAAFTPSTAPVFYRFAFAPDRAAANFFSYLDRGATFAIAIVLVWCLLCRQLPALAERERRVLVAAFIWFCGAYALTLWLPIRSSLYAVFPSIGAALACAMLVDWLRRAAPDPPRRTAWLAVMLASVLLGIPIYRSRGLRWTEPARISRETVVLLRARDDLPTHGVVLLEDTATPRAGFDDAFGVLATEAIRLVTGRELDAHIVTGGPAPSTGGGAAGSAGPAGAMRGRIVARYRVREDGRVEAR